MPRILTLTPNSALDLWTTTERLLDRHKLRCASPRLDPGGGGINVSRVIQRLGGETLALFTAGGAFGSQIVSMLRDQGIHSECVGIAGQSRLSIHVAEDATGKVFRLVMPGPTLTASEGEDLLDRFSQHAGDAALAVASGSLPPGLGEDFWARVADRARQAGCRLVLDSHDGVRPALEKGIFLLRQDWDEAADLVGRAMAWPGEAADWASGEVGRGACEMVIVTHGAEGALLATGTGRVRVAPPKVDARGAVGAGDSFIGAFCLALARDEAPEHALRWGVAAAAAALLTPGTELCREEDVRRLLGQCSPAEPL